MKYSGNIVAIGLKHMIGSVSCQRKNKSAMPSGMYDMNEIDSLVMVYQKKVGKLEA